MDAQSLCGRLHVHGRTPDLYVFHYSQKGHRRKEQKKRQKQRAKLGNLEGRAGAYLQQMIGYKLEPKHSEYAPWFRDELVRGLSGEECTKLAQKLASARYHTQHKELDQLYLAWRRWLKKQRQGAN